MNAVKISNPEMQQFEIDHIATMRRLAPECMVLLKKNGDFPLQACCDVALYGSGARQTIKGGSGSGDVNVRHYTTVEEGLENAELDGYMLVYDKDTFIMYDGKSFLKLEKK